MAETDVELVNRAIVILGASPLQGLDDLEDDVAIVCKSVYLPLVRSVLSQHEWHFSRRLAKLTRDLDAPTVTRWAYKFQLPPDRISGGFFAVYQSQAQGAPVSHDWDIMGDRLYANVPDLWVRYSKLVPVGDFPAYFEEFLVTAIRAEVAFPITDQQNTAGHWSDVAYGRDRSVPGGLLLAALTTDAQQHPHEAISGGYDLIAARY